VVLHFLTDGLTREDYARQVAQPSNPVVHVIVTTFGPDPGRLYDQFGSAFRLVDHGTELHQTPSGAIQQFVYCYCRFE
jgi:hypothetical protein